MISYFLKKNCGNRPSQHLTRNIFMRRLFSYTSTFAIAVLISTAIFSQKQKVPPPPPPKINAMVVEKPVPPLPPPLPTPKLLSNDPDAPLPPPPPPPPPPKKESTLLKTKRLSQKSSLVIAANNERLKPAYRQAGNLFDSQQWIFLDCFTTPDSYRDAMTTFETTSVLLIHL